MKWWYLFQIQKFINVLGIGLVENMYTDWLIANSRHTVIVLSFRAVNCNMLFDGGNISGESVSKQINSKNLFEDI